MAPMMTTTARPSGPPVPLLAKADELHFELVQLVEYFEEVLQRTGDPVRVLAKDFIPR